MQDCSDLRVWSYHQHFTLYRRYSSPSQISNLCNEFVITYQEMVARVREGQMKLVVGFTEKKIDGTELLQARIGHVFTLSFVSHHTIQERVLHVHVNLSSRVMSLCAS